MIKFEKRGFTWVCFDDRWDLMIIARNLYYGTDRLLSTATLARVVEGAPNQSILTDRMDLLIASRRKAFSKLAAERLKSGGGGSQEGLESAVNTMLDALQEYLELTRGEVEHLDLEDIAVPEKHIPPQYALWPLVPSSRPGMLVGPSGQGKSGLAALCGLSVVTGKTLLPRFEPRAEGPVLYIGQEEDKTQWAIRIHQICRGHGIVIPKHYIYLRLSSGSLIDSVEQVAEQVATKHAALVIIDSAQATWGAESESVRGYASQWFNAVDQLGAPAMIIEHPNRAETGKPNVGGFAAGSSVKRDRVGHAWNLKSVEMPERKGEPFRYHVTLTDTKRNYVQRQPDITYETLINGYEWVRFVEAEEMSADTIVQSSRKDDAVSAVMRNEIKEDGWSAGEITKKLGGDDKSVYSTLNAQNWRLARWDESIQYRFTLIEGTGTSPINPKRYRLETNRIGIQMSMLPGDPDDLM